MAVVAQRFAPVYPGKERWPNFLLCVNHSFVSCDRVPSSLLPPRISSSRRNHHRRQHLRCPRHTCCTSFRWLLPLTTVVDARRDRGCPPGGRHSVLSWCVKLTKRPWRTPNFGQQSRCSALQLLEPDVLRSQSFCFCPFALVDFVRDPFTKTVSPTSYVSHSRACYSLM